MAKHTKKKSQRRVQHMHITTLSILAGLMVGVSVPLAIHTQSVPTASLIPWEKLDSVLPVIHVPGAVRSKEKTRARPSAPAAGSTMQERVASRLQTRVGRSWKVSIPFSSYFAAVKERQDLLKKSAAVTFTDGTNTLAEWDVTPDLVAHWIQADIQKNSIHFALAEKQVEDHLRAFPPEVLVPPRGSALLSVEPIRGGLLRAHVDSVAKSGYDFSEEKAAGEIAKALLSNERTVSVRVDAAPGNIVNLTRQDFGSLQLLATGRSNFAGSGEGRKFNVRKGLNDRISNILVPPGEIFSFNTVLGPLSRADGWRDALGIFNGSDLRPVMGGGLCQVATTVYRAAIAGGFPITMRKPHSLYVTYYAMHGVGLDATIFPGQQDLTFKNDTPGYLLIQSYTEGDEAFVNIYGTPDGRTVTLEGPFLSSNAPDVELNGRPLYRNEIVWKQRISRSDGSADEKTLVSRYKSVPNALHAQYATVHASAE